MNELIIEIDNKDDLIGAFLYGERLKYVFFWGHTPRHDQPTPGKECMSQWYPAGFDVDGVHYPTAEHFMMAKKAELFADDDALAKILAAESAAEAKKLGRTVLGFNGYIWNEHKFEIVTRASLEKFSQNPTLRDYLISTGDHVLVEASPQDKIWGIGLAQDHQNAEHPDLWPGQNLLGFALMRARMELMKQTK